jgi:hypothetical protein
MHSLPIQISSPKTEGILQVSKWIKIQVLLDLSEMQQLLQALGSIFFVVVSEPVAADEAVVLPQDFFKKYTDYVHLLKQGQAPNVDEFRRYFSCALSSSLETFYAIAAGNDKFLIKPKKPVVQLQTHHFFYSTLDGKFHPMVLSPESISWGLQLSYPQLFQDPVTRQIVKVTDSSDFPNTAMFSKLLKWMRSFTLPTPFEVEGVRINSPMRIGKQALAWIKNHPQLKQKGIQVATI